MNSISHSVAVTNTFGSQTPSLVKEAQLNIITKGSSDGVTNNFLSRQRKDAERYASRKESKRLFEKQLREFGYEDEANRFARCSQKLRTLKCDPCKKVFRPLPLFRCGLPFCPDCSLNDGNREYRRTQPKFLQALRDDVSLTVAFMTLTRKVDPDRDLQTTCKEIKRAFNNLRRRAVFASCVGGYFRIESTITDNGWNVHLHATVLLKKRMRQRDLSAAWLDITGDSKITDIRSVTDIADGLGKTLHYPFKPADMHKMHKAEVEQMLAMKGKRLGQSFGVLFGIETDAGIVEDNEDEYGKFIAKVKRLKVGDPCPICDSPLRLVELSADELIAYLRSIPKPVIDGVRCRDG
jgi:hypothetical protein